MKAAFEDRMRAHLLARRSELFGLARSNQVQEAELRATPEPDWEDAAAVLTASRLLSTLRDAEREEIVAIAEALERLRDGRYGICAACGEEIPRRRLEANPEAERCMECVTRGDGRP